MMKKIHAAGLVLIALILFLFSCKKDPASVPDAGYGYFPVNPGHSVVYEVDSTVWDDFLDTVLYYHAECLETIESVFTDGEGKESQRIERYGRLSDTADWILRDVWYSHANTVNAQKVEENIRFIKLAFPVSADARWNGNAFNTLGEEEYKYTGLFEPRSVGGIQFDSTVTVLQSADSNLVYKKLSYEIYAKGVGLIYRENFDVEYNTNPLDGTIRSGKRIIYQIKSYSN